MGAPWKRKPVAHRQMSFTGSTNDDDMDSAGQAATSPYDCSLSQPSGVYELQAIGYYGSPSCIWYSPIRKINLINGTAQINTIGQMYNLGDSAGVYLVNIPVVAGPSDTFGANMDPNQTTVFYVEDPSRSGGIRIEANESFAAGTLVSINGTLHLTGSLVTERYVSADSVYSTGSITPPGPLLMTSKTLGGIAPTNAPGITGGVGLYNIGLLARITGRVTYVGDSYVYIDDGCGIKDGNSLQGAIIVPLADSAAGTVYQSPVSGVRVYCGASARPGIGDYVCVTGISSDLEVVPNLVRCLRTRSQADITYSSSYKRCYKLHPYGGFVASDSSGIAIGSKVRLVNALVDCNYGSYLKVLHTDSLSRSCTGLWSDIDATTALLSSAATPTSPVNACGLREAGISRP